MAIKASERWENVFMREAEVKATRRIFRIMLEARFGTIPAAILEQINACQDVGQLEAWIQQAACIKSLEELNLG